MQDSAGNIIELKGIDKIYPGAVDNQVLFQIDLQFERGSFSSIVGESGSGKSTLLNIIGTLDRPTRGEVHIDGKRTDTLDKNKLAELRNRTIGFVFQFHYLLPEFTARENVLMPYLIQNPRPTDEINRRADELLEMVGISHVKDHRPGKMSGGEQQRTAIARALINSPPVVLADEPTGNLDSSNTKNIYKIFREANERYGTTFIIVTHDRRIAEETDRIVEIKDGRIEMDVRREAQYVGSRQAD
jgi:lipoprotein-releasing system ATP-binding protein